MPGTFRVPFNTAPDLYTWRRRPFALDVRFRAPPGPIIDVSASRLDLAINGQYLRSYPLATPDPSWGWIARKIGLDPSFQDHAAAIPPYDVFGRNELQLSFDARPIHRGDCVAIPGDIPMSVDPDSTIDLSRAYRFTEMPNLAFLVNSGFPFTRMADLSETAIILPDRPSPTEISAYLGLMGYIGSLTGYPVLRATVIRPEGLDSAGDCDLLLMGTLAHLGRAADLLRDAPVHVDGGRVDVALSSPLASVRRLFGDHSGDDRARLATELSANPGEDSAILIGTASPLHAGPACRLPGGIPPGIVRFGGHAARHHRGAQHPGRFRPVRRAPYHLVPGRLLYTVGSLPLWL